MSQFNPLMKNLSGQAKSPPTIMLRMAKRLSSIPSDQVNLVLTVIFELLATVMSLSIFLITGGRFRQRGEQRGMPPLSVPLSEARGAPAPQALQGQRGARAHRAAGSHPHLRRVLLSGRTQEPYPTSGEMIEKSRPHSAVLQQHWFILRLFVHPPDCRFYWE